MSVTETAEIADRTRAERATVTVADRLRAATSQSVSVRVAGVGVLQGRVSRVAGIWLLLVTAADTEWLVARTAVMGVVGLTPHAVKCRSGVDAGLGWPSTWRVLARDRARVQVVRTDASAVTGVPEKVGRDYVELRVGGLDLTLSPAQSRAAPCEVVPYDSIAAVRCPRHPTQ